MVVTKKIRVHNKLGDDIVIEPRQNDFLDLFMVKLQHCIDEGYGITSWREWIPKPSKPWDQQIIDQLLSDLADTIQAINDMSLNFPIDITTWQFKDDAESRQMLNDLHRCFTTGHETHWIWQHGTNHTFEVAVDDRKEFSRLVHNINHVVHVLEQYVTSERMRDYGPYCEYHVNFQNDHVLRGPMPRYMFIPKEHDQFRHHGGEFDVWLPLTQIQGKDYCRAYFDYDDPCQWDICTGILYSGDFVMGDRAAHRDPRLESWLREHNIEPGPLTHGMPVGNIVTNRHLVDQLQESDVTGVTIA